MGIRHVDGEFNESHFSKDFGFKGSAEPPRGRYAKGGHVTKIRQPYADGGPVMGDPIDPSNPDPGMAKGGHVPGRRPMPMDAAEPDADDMPPRPGGRHPDGQHIVRTEPMAGGGAICHHAHGGRTVVNADGTSQHFSAGGPVEGGSFPDEPTSEPRQLEADGTGFARGGRSRLASGNDLNDPMDSNPDLTRRIRQLPQRADGMDTDPRTTDASRSVDDGYSKGGRARLAPSMRPKVMQRHSPIGNVNHAPRNPMSTVSPSNDMPGGQMGYGVQPGAEPDMAGSEQGVPQMKRGGGVRMGRGRSSFE